MADLTPEDIASRSFRSAFRGFDPDEVQRFLSQVAEAVHEIVADRDRIRNRLTEMGDADLKAEFQAVGHEVGQVLEAARQAAESMRERAAADAARWRSEAMAETEAERRRARTDAEHLRGDAWTTAEELLNQAQREAKRIVDDAEKDALRRVGEAEREAHRIQTASRREADELVRNARMEAERLVIEASARRDVIIESAQKQAESAQERTRALEQRRDELKKELDSVKEALSALEGELDERRERLGFSPGVETARDLEDNTHWEPGETVRIIRPQGDKPAHSEPISPRTDVSEVTPQELAPKVKVIPASEVARWETKERESEAAQETQPEGEAEPEVVSQPQVETEEAEEPDASVEGVEGEVGGEAEVEETPPVDRGSRFDELAGLFARLREPDEPEREAVPAGDTEHMQAVADVTAALEPEPASGIDAFELRDRKLLPVANEALRALKRHLTDHQNVSLEDLRLEPDGWMPDAEALKQQVAEDLMSLIQRSFVAGHEAAEELLGTQADTPGAPSDGAANSFAADLSRELGHVLDEGRAESQGVRQLSASVSRVFRAWRTDESERRVRDLSLSAFNEGIAATFKTEGISDFRWLVSGRGCATCRASAAEAPALTRPPAHPGCGCAIVPMRS